MKHFSLLLISLLCFTSGLIAQKQYKDNIELLNDERINPIFAGTLRQFIDSAKKAGFKPVIKEAYRSFAKAKQTAEINKKLKKAAAAVSVHSFGLAVDIWLANDKNEIFSYDQKEYEKNKTGRFSYSKWMEFIKIGQSFNLINAFNHDDTDHWELHPNWDKNDWISASKVILPIYNKYPQMTEVERLKIIWKDAGL